MHFARPSHRVVPTKPAGIAVVVDPGVKGQCWKWNRWCTREPKRASMLRPVSFDSFSIPPLPALPYVFLPSTVAGYLYSSPVVVVIVAAAAVVVVSRVAIVVGVTANYLSSDSSNLGSNAASLAVAVVEQNLPIHRHRRTGNHSWTHRLRTISTFEGGPGRTGQDPPRRYHEPTTSDV